MHRDMYMPQGFPSLRAGRSESVRYAPIHPLVAQVNYEACSHTHTQREKGEGAGRQLDIHRTRSPDRCSALRLAERPSATNIGQSSTQKEDMTPYSTNQNECVATGRHWLLIQQLRFWSVLAEAFRPQREEHS